MGVLKDLLLIQPLLAGPYLLPLPGLASSLNPGGNWSLGASGPEVHDMGRAEFWETRPPERRQQRPSPPE